MRKTMYYFIATLWALMSALLFVAMHDSGLGSMFAVTISALAAFAVWISAIEGAE